MKERMKDEKDESERREIERMIEEFVRRKKQDEQKKRR